MMEAWLFGALIALAFVVCLHYATKRFFAATVLPRFLIVSGWTGLGLGLWLLVLFGPGMKTLAALLVYAFGCELYVFSLTLPIASVSANLLLKLREGSLTRVQIDERYDNARMVELRLDRMESQRLLFRDGEYISLAPRGRLLLAAFMKLGSVFGTFP